MTDEVQPPGIRRRHDDFVTFREMVEYFAKQESEWHTMRAEGFISMNNQLEKLDDRVEKTLNTLADNLNKHEEWHRNVLQGLIDRGNQSKIAIVAIIVSIVGMAVSTGVGIIAVVVNH